METDGPIRQSHASAAITRFQSGSLYNVMCMFVSTHYQVHQYTTGQVLNI